MGDELPKVLLPPVSAAFVPSSGGARAVWLKLSDTVLEKAGAWGAAWTACAERGEAIDAWVTAMEEQKEAIGAASWGAALFRKLAACGSYYGERDAHGGRHTSGAGGAPAVAVLPSGDVYVGPYRSQKRDGLGMYRFAEGDVFVGEHHAGHFAGVGVLLLRNGVRYAGEFANGLRNGVGTLTQPDGTTYAGQWSNGEPTGVAVVTSPAGVTLSGRWNKGQLELGEWRVGDRVTFQGSFASNQPSGVGRFAFGVPSASEFVEGVYHPRPAAGEGDGDGGDGGDAASANPPGADWVPRHLYRAGDAGGEGGGGDEEGGVVAGSVAGEGVARTGELRVGVRSILQSQEAAQLAADARLQQVAARDAARRADALLDRAVLSVVTDDALRAELEVCSDGSEIALDGGKLSEVDLYVAGFYLRDRAVRVHVYVSATSNVTEHGIVAFSEAVVHGRARVRVSAPQSTLGDVAAAALAQLGAQLETVDISGSRVANDGVRLLAAALRTGATAGDGKRALVVTGIELDEVATADLDAARSAGVAAAL